MSKNPSGGTPIYLDIPQNSKKSTAEMNQSTKQNSSVLDLEPSDQNMGITEKRLSCIEINIDDLSAGDKFSNTVLSRKISENVDKLMLSDQYSSNTLNVSK